jgi:hypothetical protein
VINNASGTLRPLVEGLLKGQMPAEGLQQFLALVFYPAEVVAMLEVQLRTAQAQKQFAMKALRALFAIVRALAARRPLQPAVRLFPRQYRELLAEILHEPSSDREREYVEAIVHECLYSICMHGPGVQTVSYTEVVVSPTELTMRYQASAPCRRCPAITKTLPVRYVGANHRLQGLGFLGDLAIPESPRLKGQACFDAARAGGNARGGHLRAADGQALRASERVGPKPRRVSPPARPMRSRAPCRCSSSRPETDADQPEKNAVAEKAVQAAGKAQVNNEPGIKADHLR